MGSLSVVACVQDPDVRVEPETPTVLRIDEGAVALALEFPDRDAVRRFQLSVGAVEVPEEPRP
jgi:hypothetical protein